LCQAAASRLLAMPTPGSGLGKEAGMKQRVSIRDPVAATAFGLFPAPVPKGTG